MMKPPQAQETSEAKQMWQGGLCVCVWELIKEEEEEENP